VARPASTGCCPRGSTPIANAATPVFRLDANGTPLVTRVTPHSLRGLTRRAGETTIGLTESPAVVERGPHVRLRPTAT
jgi:hypothetical protein